MTDAIVHSQTSVAIHSMKHIISDKILEKLQEFMDNGTIKYLSFDRVKILTSDFKDHELPGVQLYDVAENGVHEMSRLNVTWQIALEIVMKSTQQGIVGQKDLWDLEYLIKRKLWANPNLGIKGVMHLQYIGSQTDLHMLEPYYVARLDFQVLYYEPLVRAC